jgi:ParB/RepB/Spo0J family partition protein
MSKTGGASAKMVEVANIKTSATNARGEEDYKGKAQEELEASIKASGLAQPVLIRPLKAGGFELVAGERRLRAHKALGLKEIAAYVRELSDEEAMALQAVENSQRKDLSPLKEATYYRTMAEKMKIPTREIAARVGQSPAYVVRRMKLLTLGEKVLKRLDQEQIGVACAEEFARISDPERQLEAIEEAEYQAREGNVKRVREIVEGYLLALKDAPFNIEDAALVPKAGACGACPKRTGNQSSLFAGVEKADLCLDAACWKSKEDAHYKAALAKYAREGKKTLTARETAEAVEDDKLVPVSDRDDHLAKGTVRQALAASKTKVETVIGVVGGKVVELVNREKARAAYPKSMVSAYYRQEGEGHGEITEKQREKLTAERRKTILDNKAGAAAWTRIWPGVVGKLASKPLAGKNLRDFLEVLLDHHMGYHNVRGINIRLSVGKGMTYDTSTSKVVKALRATKGDKAALELAWNLMLGDGNGYTPSSIVEASEACLKMAGVSWAAEKAVEARRITAERAAKAKAKGAAKPAAKAKPARKAKPKK